MKRVATILAPTDIGAAGTRVEDLNIRGQISRLSLQWEFTVVTVSVMTGNILSCLSKIEVVDGSEVLFSASGEALAGINFYETGKPAFAKGGLTVGNVMRAHASINFGRWLWDGEFGLRTDMYRNPQIRITFDEDAANGSVVVNSLGIVAYVDDNPPNGGANGFLLTKEAAQHAMAASTHDYTDLPIDYPHRAVFVRPYSADHDPRTLVDNLKLDGNNSGVVPIDIATDILIDAVMSDYGPITESWIADGALTAKTVYANTSQNNIALLGHDDTAVTAAGEIQASSWTGEILSLTTGVAITTDWLCLIGYIPHYVVPVFFGEKMDPDSWLDPSGLNDLRADTLMSSDADSGDTLTVLTQQWKRY